MSYLVAPFCSELEELTYDLVEGAFRQEPSVSIDRLHRHLGLSFGDHDSQIAITLGTGALKVLRHSALSRGQAFVHHEPRNLQPKPFRQRFHADGEPAKLKALDLQD
jgi:hypothetical protein